MFFENCKNVAELKKEYYKLALKFHPDITGDDGEKMKEINSRYDEALKIIQTENKKRYHEDNEFKNIIDFIIRMGMVNVTIEVCGWFIYLHGETKQYWKILKENGFIWNPKKYVVYWKPSWYRKRGKETWSMEKIRNTFGSEIIKEKEEKSRELLPA